MPEKRSSDEIPGWVLLSPEDVPDVWRARGVTLVLVPMMPSEVAQVLSQRPADQAIPSSELPLVRLVARGHSAEQIARELGVASRTVHRHVARLRDAFGVSSLQELATELARRGF